jgi:eukaryotic-like serine/threonine-protein kinase
MAQPTLEQSSISEPVSRYTMYGEIAAGGMGTVHLGRVQGAAGFSRTVAIKRLHPHFASESDIVSMLVDEARMAACIHHPNVVSTLDVVYQGEELLLVMDYVEGETLARLIECTKRNSTVRAPSLAVTLAVLSDVLFGLHAAHTARSASGKPLEIVHRDVSPHNVIVGTDGVARVHDFGIAKAARRRHNTRPGQIKGKFAYMAPEQILGLPVDARTDVFAAGVMLWECLAQRRLFFAESPQATIQKVLTGATTAPSRFNSQVTPELDQVVLKALSPRLEDRFSTAEEFAEALSTTRVHAKRTDVGHWVRERARQALAERARQLQQVEASVVTGVTRVTAVINVARQESGDTLVLNPPPAAAMLSSSIPPTTQAKTSRPERSVASARRWPALLALAGSAALTAALGFSLGRAPISAASFRALALPEALASDDSRSRSSSLKPLSSAAPVASSGRPQPTRVSETAPVVALEELVSEPAPKLAASAPAATARTKKGSRRAAPTRKLKAPAVVAPPSRVSRPSL